MALHSYPWRNKNWKNCTIGQNVMIGPDVIVVINCKIQNNVSLFKGKIDNGVFVGLRVFLIIKSIKKSEANEFIKTHVEKGVSIGANGY